MQRHLNHAAWVATLVTVAVMLTACGGETGDTPQEAETMAKELATYTTLQLTTDLDALTEKQRQMIPLLVDACAEMDAVFWMQAYGDRDALLGSISDADARWFAEINYGPWDRLRGDAPFLAEYGEKPEGAQFYPKDMSEGEFESACDASPEKAEALRSLYTMVRWDDEGGLVAVPYHEAFPEHTRRAAAKLREAAALAEDSGLRLYLEMRADALLSDKYFDSDLAWLDMKDNVLDVVIGPIETYEDALFGYKAAHEGYVLVKDMDWSERLARYAALLPDLQRDLPVPDEYKKETPGTDSDLNAYDVVYYAGHCNAGAKTIAINLPNDEQVQDQKGSRRLQLKNAMRAKFDNILLPISDVLIAEDQRGNIRFDAFFENVMFHEVAHGLGIKHTINDKGTVREALKDQQGALEEAKADVLGLYLLTRLHEMGELDDATIEDNYVTFLAGFFRSVRFGGASAHGRANLAELDYFQKMGAFTRDDATGTYRVIPDKMLQAVTAMARDILVLQGNGDYVGVTRFLPDPEAMDPVLAGDLERLAEAEIPIDIVFEQGAAVLGL